MTARDIYPHSPSEKGTSFHLGMNRRAEVTLQKELGHLVKKSFNDIAAYKQSKALEPLSHEAKVTRTLGPEFTPTRKKDYKKRSEPVFTEKIDDAKIKPVLGIIGSTPQYNPLDKLEKGVKPSVDRTKKLPYSKDASITTADMKKPKISTLGVLPKAYHSDEVGGLRVVLEGKSAISADDQTIGAIERANTEAGEQLLPPEGADDAPTDTTKPATKPAILGSEGTTYSVNLIERGKPPARPRSRLAEVRTSRRDRPRSARTESRKSAKSIPSSLKSSEIILPDEAVFSQYDDIIADIDTDISDGVPIKKSKLPPGGIPDDQRSLASSASSVKSVKELLEEARQISTTNEPLYKRHDRDNARKASIDASKKPTRAPLGAVSKKGTAKSSKSDKSYKSEDKEQKKEDTTRTVDEIILSLKNQTKHAGLSEADRKIQDIMNRVMENASSVLADIGDHKEEDEDKSEDGDGKSRSTSRSQPVDTYDLIVQSVLGTGVQKAKSADSKKEAEHTGAGLVGAGGGSSTLISDPSTSKLPKTESMVLDEQRGRIEAPPTPLPMSEPISSTMPGSTYESDDEDLNGEEDDGQLTTPDLLQAYADLQLPVDVALEELVFIEGRGAELEPRKPYMTHESPSRVTSAQTPAVSLLSSWIPADTKPPMRGEHYGRDLGRNIHHFCTMTTDIQLPKELQSAARMFHTAGKYGVTHGKAESHETKTDREADQSRASEAAVSEMMRQNNEREHIQSAAARRILQEAGETKGRTVDDSLEMWADRAQQVFEEVQSVAVEGRSMEIKSDISRLYWTPAPPKMAVPPNKVRQQLFPKYTGAVINESDANLHQTFDDLDDSDLGSNDGDALDPEDVLITERILSRRYHSARDLTKLIKASMEQEEENNKGQALMEEKSKTMSLVTVTSVASSSSFRYTVPSKPEVVEEPEEPPVRLGPLTDDEIFPCFPPPRRAYSLPNLDIEEEYLFIPQGFDVAMEEISKQKVQIEDVLEGKAPSSDEEDSMQEVSSLASPRSKSIAKSALTTDNLGPMQLLRQKRRELEEQPTPAELALKAGRKYVLLPKKKKTKRPIDMARLEEVQQFIRQAPNPLERTSSLPKVKMTLQRDLRVPHHVRARNRRSLPDLLNFEDFSSKRGLIRGDAKQHDERREWVRDIWNIWFDETFPATQSELDAEDVADLDDISPRGEYEKLMKKSEEEAAQRAEIIENLQLEPVLDTTDDSNAVELLQDEVDKLSRLIEMSEGTRAFDLCRRGALYRKLGQLKDAWQDLNTAIKLEPMLLDAYWHRHLLYLLQDKKQAALDDLNYLLKHSKNQPGPYRSRAEIYREAGDITMAIVNYTQAIKLNPEDHDAYFKRAEMYEQRGEMLLALEDYGMTTKLMPTRTDAIFKHGLYYFNNGNWQNAIVDFTELLRQEPNSGLARTYRGQAFAKLGLWNPACEDLSAAIHLDPNSSVAHYHRGCILRTLQPKKALQDFSVSILVDDSEDNVQAFLHRGILYNSLGKPEDAIPDFEAVLRLDSSIAVAHVNLGLIYMTKMESFQNAIRKFTSAIKVDPTYLRAYLCRSEAYNRIHDTQNALLDITRAIHLRPDVHHLYMIRGQLVLEMGNFDLAAFCVQHASELGSGLGQSPMQQAVVQSFLKHYDKAVNVLAGAVRQKPVAQLFVLLGKTQIKAKTFNDAINSFEKALGILKPWTEKESWPLEAAEVHYLIGMCYMELRNYLGALEAFNNAIKIDTTSAEAFYNRGLARMRLKQSKGIQDFNRALAIDPTIFQAYLSRASYYGLRKQFSKAILNCNEAIKRQPNSVRAYLYRGALKYHIKAYKLAIADLSKAASIESTCALAYFNRAVCHHDSGDWQKALMDYGIVLLLGDDLQLKVLINRGLLYYEHKDYRNSLQDFLLASSINPRDKKIHHTVGLCYHKLNKLKDAVSAFTRALRLDQFFLDGYIGRGNVYMDYGHREGQLYARNDYERALHLNPLYLPARVNLAFNQQVLGKYQLSWCHFTAAITHDPTFKAALEGRAVVNLQMSNLFAAFQDITASIHIRPSAELLTNRGVINQFMQDNMNAMSDYQAALKLDSSYSLAYFNAANIYFHTRQFRQAKLYYDKAIDSNPKDESALLNRAITKVLLRDATGALEDFKAAIKLSPYTAHMYFNRGNLYSSLQQYDKAEKDYSKALQLQPNDALVYKRRADVRGKLGKRDAAINDYKYAIELQSHRDEQVQDTVSDIM